MGEVALVPDFKAALRAAATLVLQPDEIKCEVDLSDVGFDYAVRDSTTPAAIHRLDGDWDSI